MTRLPTLLPRKVIAALKRGGFVDDGQKGSHRYFWHPLRDVTTCVPVHGRDIKRKLLKEILNQAGLSEDEFRKLL